MCRQLSGLTPRHVGLLIQLGHARSKICPCSPPCTHARLLLTTFTFFGDLYKDGAEQLFSYTDILVHPVPVARPRRKLLFVFRPIMEIFTLLGILVEIPRTPRSLNHLICLGISTKMAQNNAFTVAKRTLEGQDMIYQSIKLTNGIWALIGKIVDILNPSLFVVFFQLIPPFSHFLAWKKQIY